MRCAGRKYTAAVGAHRVAEALVAPAAHAERDGLLPRERHHGHERRAVARERGAREQRRGDVALVVVVEANVVAPDQVGLRLPHLRVLAVLDRTVDGDPAVDPELRRQLLRDVASAGNRLKAHHGALPSHRHQAQRLAVAAADDGALRAVGLDDDQLREAVHGHVAVDGGGAPASVRVVLRHGVDQKAVADAAGAGAQQRSDVLREHGLGGPFELERRGRDGAAGEHDAHSGDAAVGQRGTHRRVSQQRGQNGVLHAAAVGRAPLQQAAWHLRRDVFQWKRVHVGAPAVKVQQYLARFHRHAGNDPGVLDLEERRDRRGGEGRRGAHRGGCAGGRCVNFPNVERAARAACVRPQSCG